MAVCQVDYKKGPILYEWGFFVALCCSALKQSADIRRERVAAFIPNPNKALGNSASIFHCPTYSLIFVD